MERRPYHFVSHHEKVVPFGELRDFQQLVLREDLSDRIVRRVDDYFPQLMRAAPTGLRHAYLSSLSWV